MSPPGGRPPSLWGRCSPHLSSVVSVSVSVRLLVGGCLDEIAVPLLVPRLVDGRVQTFPVARTWTCRRRSFPGSGVVASSVENWASAVCLASVVVNWACVLIVVWPDYIWRTCWGSCGPALAGCPFAPCPSAGCPTSCRPLLGDRIVLADPVSDRPSVLAPMDMSPWIETGAAA